MKATNEQSGAIVFSKIVVGLSIAYTMPRGWVHNKNEAGNAVVKPRWIWHTIMERTLKASGVPLSLSLSLSLSLCVWVHMEKRSLRTYYARRACLSCQFVGYNVDLERILVKCLAVCDTLSGINLIADTTKTFWPSTSRKRDLTVWNT